MIRPKNPVISLALLPLVWALAACDEPPAAPNPASVPDTASPTLAVVETAPISGGTGIARAAHVSVLFSDVVSPSTVHAGSFTLWRDNLLVAADITVDGAIAKLIPRDLLELGTTYSARVTTAVRDTAGRALRVGHHWEFRTKENRLPAARR